MDQAGSVTPVRLEVKYPGRLSRLLLPIKWLLVIPWHIVILVYAIVANLVAVYPPII